MSLVVMSDQCACTGNTDRRIFECRDEWARGYRTESEQSNPIDCDRLGDV